MKGAYSWRLGVPNMSVHTNTQQQDAAARRFLRAGLCRCWSLRMRYLYLAFIALNMAALATAGGFEMKEIKYRGGIVRFSVPSHWLEEYERDGGGTFYENAPNTGTFRVNVVTAKSPTVIGRDSAFQLLQSLKSVKPERIRRLSSGNAIATSVQHSSEQGQTITLFWWHVANPVPPLHMRTVNFSFTVHSSQEDTARTKREIEMLAKSIENAVFRQSLGQ